MFSFYYSIYNTNFNSFCINSTYFVIVLKKELSKLCNFQSGRLKSVLVRPRTLKTRYPHSAWSGGFFIALKLISKRFFPDYQLVFFRRSTTRKTIGESTMLIINSIIKLVKIISKKPTKKGTPSPTKGAKKSLKNMQTPAVKIAVLTIGPSIAAIMPDR